jgi:hypothetical protein
LIDLDGSSSKSRSIPAKDYPPSSVQKTIKFSLTLADESFSRIRLT